MANPYLNYIGNMKSIISYPAAELTNYIEKYVFYENSQITNDVYFKPYSSGSIELFLHYNKSYICISNKKKKNSFR
jgi:hypothetical protein